ncbi:Irregular chiasm C-roughest protein-like 1 [Homarus americanus]|uniref:Irregular chiasm C-roughest protein-like 1 n=1 Tax=Homarus americanus TaxID=6706 RepID=A0A8J5MPL3_HOMAM|nr:Irregular chiasm C-roughest protein-like 1 [Homarus americanus]
MRLLRVLSLVAWAWGVVGAGEQRVAEQAFATMPSHQTAVLGSTAVLPCRVINQRGLVQWTRDGFGLGTQRGLEGFERYSMIGADEEGDFSLRISPVTLEDDAEYQCQVSSATELPLRSQVARLTVFVPPKPPTVTHPAFATAGVPLTLTCSSSGGRPAPEIHSGVQLSEDLMEDEKRVNAHATLTFTPTRHHHARSLTCLTHNPALHTPLAAKVRLNVEYPPEVQLQFSPEELSEGVEASVTCRVEANPGEVTYRWFRGGSEVAGAQGSTLPLGVLSRADNASPVAYAPLFVTAPSSQSAEPDQRVTLKCRVDANPPPDITWSRPNNPKVVGRGPELLVSATPTSAGLYVCSARSPGFSPLEGRVHLRIRGPPLIRAQAVVAVPEGQPAVLRCGVVAVPHPVSVTWTREGALVVSEDGRYVNEEQRADGVVSTLTINKTSHRDFASYNCSVINEYGVDTHQILLQRQPVVPLMVIVGGGAGVVLVVIVVILFILCGRKKNGGSSAKDKAAEAGTVVVEKSCGGGGGRGMGGSGGVGSGGGGDGGTMGTALKVMPPSLLPSHDNHSTGQESDAKDAEIRTSSSLSAADRDSDSGWERESSKASPRDPQAAPLTHARYSVGSTVFTPPDQGYISYVDYTRDYSPVPVSVGDSYAQFQMGGPYARSTPASDPPSSLPSSVAPPPYTPPPHTTTDLNGGMNGRVHASSNGKIVNGNGGVNGTLKHALLQDLKQELKRELSHDLDSAALHSKYIIPPQTKIKPGTLV